MINIIGNGPSLNTINKSELFNSNYDCPILQTNRRNTSSSSREI